MTNQLLSRVTREFDRPHNPSDSEMTNKLLSRVTLGLDSRESHYGLRNHQRTAVTGDACIRQPKRPPRESEISKELLSRVTRGFDSPQSPLGPQK